MEENVLSVGRCVRLMRVIVLFFHSSTTGGIYLANRRISFEYLRNESDIVESELFPIIRGLIASGARATAAVVQWHENILGEKCIHFQAKHNTECVSP